MSESLNDLLINTLTYVEKARQETADINDYGKVSGISEEFISIDRDLTTSLQRIRERAINLGARARKFKEAEEKGGAA